MADTGYPITVVVGGLTVVVSITPAAGVFTDAAMGTPATFPATITVDTVWYTRSGGYTVSATHDGLELADSAGVASVSTGPGAAAPIISPAVNLTGAKAAQAEQTPSLTTLRFGGAAQNAYTVEGGQDNDTLAVDLSFVRIRSRASRDTSSPASFFGATALRIEVADTANVVSAGTTPYLYGARVRVAPRINRTQSGIDDLVGFMVSNRSFSDYGTAFNGTEAIYVGWGGGSTGGASKDWNAGLGIDTVADNGIYINRGPYAYGILMLGSVTTAAMRIPNNALIVGRNAADSANLNMMKVDTSNNVRLGSGAVKVAVGAPSADTDVTQSFEIHSTGATDGTFGKSHQRVIDTTAFAANVGGGIAFAGYQDATPTIRTFAGIAGRKANATSGNAAGYLSLYSRHATNGLTEVLRLTELQQLQITDAANFVLGSTTGHQIGTATTQKLALWGKTPIIQPTTAVAAAAFVVGAGTAVNDASTFGGYTIKQVVQALQNVGVLA
jgi:hypothetical protein